MDFLGSSGRLPWRLLESRTRHPKRSMWTSGRTCETLAAMNLQHLRGRVVAHVGLTVLALIFQVLHVSVGSVLLGAGLVVVFLVFPFPKGRFFGHQQVGGFVWNQIVLDLAVFALLAAVFLRPPPFWVALPFILNNAIFAVI